MATRKITRTTQKFSYTTLYQPVRGAGYKVIVPLLPGLVTYGRTFDEARKMAHDAIGCHLEALKKTKKKFLKTSPTIAPEQPPTNYCI